MTELITRISPADCGQLNGKGSCERCPVYIEALAIVTDNQQDAAHVLQAVKIATQCPVGAPIDLKGLGIMTKPVTESVQNPMKSVVNTSAIRKIRVW